MLGIIQLLILPQITTSVSPGHGNAFSNALVVVTSSSSAYNLPVCGILLVQIVGSEGKRLCQGT